MTHTDGHRQHRKSKAVVLGYRFYVDMGSSVGYHDDRTTVQLLRNYNNLVLNLLTQTDGMSAGSSFSIPINASQISNFTVTASCPIQARHLRQRSTTNY
jgi:hypothetical protein